MHIKNSLLMTLSMKMETCFILTKYLYPIFNMAFLMILKYTFNDTIFDKISDYIKKGMQIISYIFISRAGRFYE